MCTQWNIDLYYAAQYPNKANELRNILNEIIATLPKSKLQSSVFRNLLRYDFMLGFK